MYLIGEAAARSGVMIETIRYYERAGVVPSPERTPAGRRVYTDSGIGRLRFVKRCRDLGFSIADAKSLLGLADGSQETCAAASAIAQQHIGKVREKIADLRRMEVGLAELVEMCTDNGAVCPILDQLLSDNDNDRARQ